MKVLHFYKTYFPDTFGGVEQFIFELSNGLSANDVASNVLSLSSNIQTNVEDSGNEKYRVKTNFKIASTDFSISAFKEFKRLSNQADIIHYHFPWPFMDLVHFASQVKKPSVVTYHSDIIRQKNLLLLYRPLMNFFLNDVDAITVSSPNYLNSSAILQKYKSKVEVIPFGISDKKINSQNDKHAYWKNLLGDRFFLFLGVHRYYKGLHYLMDALAIEEFPIVIAGDGPQTKELIELAQKNNLKKIQFIGEISDEDKDAIFQLSYAFVFPSHLRSESFGLSLLEAAMYGKPMISCDIGTGTSFINLNNETGIVVPPESAPALQEAMSCMWSNPVDAERMGTAARQRYLNIFTKETMCQRYLDLYKKLID
ncbi:glycosyltransferase WbpZ [Polynucleobacter sp. SHI8]|uniref:glycosyltransferase family 4 protein n=1 Tax=unclassified Polynucleobacter TaxID=2640945 RepID=UPI0024903FD0|nr:MULTISPECIES: glycosyltransferase family 4 protein [unclassified Polynucleobacter]BDW10209.1 glycosyltransferase WbpZ [Polynucleobacter sp. SHI2]BDW12655.1 glycosyltransferase WbpZ [Polynucleobacter sp. SHI8]